MVFISDAAYMDLIRESDEISGKTKTLYVYALRTVAKDLDAPSIHQMLHDPAIYVARMRSRYPNDNTLKTLTSALVTTLRYAAADGSLLAAWRGLLQSASRAVSDRIDSNEPTPRQTAAHVEWPDVLRARDALPDGPDRLFLMMHTCMAPRRQWDYAAVTVYTSNDHVPDPNGGNYIHLDPPGGAPPYVRLTEFKTAKKRGAGEDEVWTKDLPRDLLDAIRRSFRESPRTYLFETRAGRKYESASSFRKWSNGVLKRALGNESASLNTLRHSYLTWYLRRHPDITLAERKAIARDMGHGVMTSLAYVLLV